MGGWICWPALMILAGSLVLLWSIMLVADWLHTRAFKRRLAGARRRNGKQRQG